MTRERALGSGKLQAGYRFQVGQMLEPARASKRMPITRHNGFVIFPTGSADPLIAFAIDVLNGTAYVHSSKRCLRGQFPNWKSIPGFGIDALIMGSGLQAEIRRFRALDSTRRGF
jgi:hypothetical protein